MDDLLYGFEYPAVIDLKMGKQTYDPEATHDKIVRHLKKHPPIQVLGFQVLGMSVSLNLHLTYILAASYMHLIKAAEFHCKIKCLIIYCEL